MFEAPLSPPLKMEGFLSPPEAQVIGSAEGTCETTGGTRDGEQESRLEYWPAMRCVSRGFIPEHYLIMSDSVRRFMFCSILSLSLGRVGRRAGKARFLVVCEILFLLLLLFVYLFQLIYFIYLFVHLFFVILLSLVVCFVRVEHL